MNTISTISHLFTGLSFQVEFSEPIVNISVAVGRDATFTCHVRHLGGYRVSYFVNNNYTYNMSSIC